MIDAGTDLRQQALVNNLDRVDLVLFTHVHADHVHGVDDLRMFNFLQMASIPCYADARAAAELRYRFSYIFEPDPTHQSTLPRLTLHEIDGEILAPTCKIIPIPIRHGRDDILGFRVGSFAYLTDVSFVPDSSMVLLAGVRTIIVSALMHHRHPTHFSVKQAIELADRLDVECAYLTHMTHSLDYNRLRQELPANVAPCYDGMVLYFDV